MYSVRTASIGALVLLSGCTGISQLGTNSPFGNPPKLNPDEELVTPNQPDSRPFQPAEIPIRNYFDKLNKLRTKYAKGDAPSSVELQEWLDDGIVLVNVHCRRWFRLLDDAQRARQLADQNINIVRDLGTALIGIARLNSDVTAVYGALNTAYTGFGNNFDQAYLVAPNQQEVQTKIFSLLQQSEAKLRSDSGKPSSFPAAYNALEDYAEICTHKTARTVVNESLGTTETQRDDSGKITSTPTPAAMSNAVSAFKDDANTRILKSFLGWDGSSFAVHSNVGALKKWLSVNAAGASIPFLLNAATMADERANAVQDLVPK